MFDQVLSYDLPGSGVAIPSGSLLATVTFLDERADITGPDAAVPAAGQTRNVNVLSAVSQSTTCRVAPTRSPASAVS